MPNELTLEDIEKYDNEYVKNSLNILYQSNILTQKNSELIVCHFNNSKTAYSLQLMQLHHLLNEDGFALLSQNIEKANDVVYTLLLEHTHEKTLKLGQYLGYALKDGGLCRGSAVRWLEACLLKEEDRFIERVYRIISTFDPKKLLAQIHDVKEKAKEQNLSSVLTEKEIETLEILAFYESLLLYQQPGKHTDTFNKSLTKFNVESISRIASSEKIRQKGDLKTVYSESWIFTRDEIITYLSQIGNIIKTGAPREVGMGILLTSYSHGVGLIFQPETDSWRFMDINQWPPKDYKANELDALVDKIMMGFNSSKNIYTAFKTEVITTANIELQQVTVKLDELKKSHKITEEIAKREAVDGITLAYFSARDGDVQMIAELASQGADLNKLNKGVTLAYTAAKFGHAQVIAELAKCGADLNKPGDNGATPAVIAAQRGKVEVIAELAKWGADLNKPYKNGATPACIAAQCGNAQVIAELAKGGADLNKPYKNGITPACIAAQCGHAQVIAELAKWGADLNKPDNDDATPAYYAAQCGNAQVIAELVKGGADLNKPCKNGITPACIAAQCGNAQVIAELVKGGADLNKPDNDGATPAYYAAKYGQAQVIAELGKQKADLNIANNNGATPAYIAARWGETQAIAELAKWGADLNKPYKNGITPAYVAAQCNHVHVVAELYKLGADLNKPQNDGSTPLLIACQEGHLDMVQFLLKKGKVNIQPFIASATSLRNFANSHGDMVINRMSQLIEDKMRNDSSEENIPVLPNEIAHIMGHDKIVKFFSEFNIIEKAEYTSNTIEKAMEETSNIIINATEHTLNIIKNVAEHTSNAVETAANSNEVYSVIQHNYLQNKAKSLFNEAKNTEGETPVASAYPYKAR